MAIDAFEYRDIHIEHVGDEGSTYHLKDEVRATFPDGRAFRHTGASIPLRPEDAGALDKAIQAAVDGLTRLGHLSGSNGTNHRFELGVTRDYIARWEVSIAPHRASDPLPLDGDESAASLRAIATELKEIVVRVLAAVAGEPPEDLAEGLKYGSLMMGTTLGAAPLRIQIPPLHVRLRYEREGGGMS